MRRGSVGRGPFAASAVVLAGLLAGCGARLGGPAPLVGGEVAAPPPMTVTVQRGQTLSGIARTYHVPMLTIAEANHLYPPYRVMAGGTLIIPGSGSAGAGIMAENVPAGGPPAFAPIPQSAPVVIAELPPPSPAVERPAPMEPPPMGSPPAATLSPPKAEAAAGAGRASAKPEREIPLDRVPPAAAGAPVIAAAPSPAGSPPPSPHGKSTAETSLAGAVPPPVHGGSAFLWPVHGHLLEGFGSGPDGTHNDGINIAAPRGAAVQAADTGVVAYAGNELRGYGNLILVKHANGWITAYAHCDLMLVKPGEKVARGQVIARVGSTGNVSEPQLHFELRRGDKAVDPRSYLAPPPTAAADRDSSRS